MRNCHHCHGEIACSSPVGRSELCPRCGRDLRSCHNCTFFDLQSYNQCREPNAEPVTEKDRANFCEYFVFRETSDPETIKRSDPRTGWDALFKKSK